MTPFREVRLGELFVPTNGKAKYIHTYLDTHPGPFPVYSASLRDEFGSISTSDFDGHYLTWIMNGYGGRMQEVNGLFSANRDRGVLVPRPEVRIPSLTYLRFLLEPMLVDQAVGRRVDGLKNEYTKLYPSAVEDIVFELPINEDGDLDFAEMERIGDRLERIERIKNETATLEAELRDAELSFDVPEPHKVVSLADKTNFRLSIGQRLLLKDVAPSGVPIYSANVQRPFGYSPHSDGLSFECPSLIWGIDGIFDWNLMPAGHEFVPTDHCGRAEIVNPNLDPEYLLYALRSTRATYGFDRVFRASLGNVGRELTVAVPLDAEGTVSVKIQKDLAMEYKKLDLMKRASLDALKGVLAARLGLQS